MKNYQFYEKVNSLKLIIFVKKLHFLHLNQSMKVKSVLDFWISWKISKKQEFELLHNNINEFFGEDIMDINFVNWFAKKINQSFPLDVCMHTPARVPFGTKEQRKWKNKNINLIVDHFYLKPFVSLSLAWILYFHVWLQNKGKFSVWSQYYNHFGIPLRITTKQLP